MVNPSFTSVKGVFTMTAINVTPDTISGGPSTGDVWSAGDYDRLASYGSAPEAAHLVRFAAVRAGERVLDVGTGSGLVAIVAAQHGARATGVDPTPQLLTKAVENAALAGCGDIEWHEGAAEALPFPDASFDVVLSQYAHMFSPQPETAAREMLRVLKPAGRLAFAAWTPHGLAPRLMGLTFRYLPPMPGPPPPSPFEWGHAPGVDKYLKDRVRDIAFEPAALQLPALSTAHARRLFEETFGPTVMLVRALSNEPARLAQWRGEHNTTAAEFFADGRLRFDYLLTQAIKV
jgi:ubiquinone/menaquinone biosynthesis C-methylase UbiE